MDSDNKASEHQTKLVEEKKVEMPSSENTLNKLKEIMSYIETKHFDSQGGIGRQ